MAIVKRIPAVMAQMYPKMGVTVPRGLFKPLVLRHRKMVKVFF